MGVEIYMKAEKAVNRLCTHLDNPSLRRVMGIVSRDYNITHIEYYKLEELAKKLLDDKRDIAQQDAKDTETKKLANARRYSWESDDDVRERLAREKAHAEKSRAEQDRANKQEQAKLKQREENKRIYQQKEADKGIKTPYRIKAEQVATRLIGRKNPTEQRLESVNTILTNDFKKLSAEIISEIINDAVHAR